MALQPNIASSFAQHKLSSSLLSSQSSPISFNAEEIESERDNYVSKHHEKQSHSEDLNHLFYETQSKLLNRRRKLKHKHKRRNTEPPHPMTNTRRNNYYSRIRFHRQTNDFFHDLQKRQEKHKTFPRRKIKNYSEFRNKYRFTIHNGNRKLLGYGAMSYVYKVFLSKDRKQKFAAKITPYTDRSHKQLIMEEHRLLHQFGNGMYIKDIYDDNVHKRLVFIQPNGKDLKTWWNHPDNGVKKKFDKETPAKQEWILKKIIYEILLNLKQIHDAGYIHHDLKPQNILVSKKKTYSDEWIDKYSFHIIDYGLTVRCAHGTNVSLDETEIRFGTFGYNAWELMKTNECRSYNHSIDLYALGITICELVIGKHCLRHYNDFKRKQEEFCYARLIEEYDEQERYFEQEENGVFFGFTDHDLYAKTLRLKCEHWRNHFKRQNTSNYNGDESRIRSIVIKELQTKTPYTTRFKNFISNIIRDDPKRRISSVQSAINHDLFYNV